MPYDIFTQPKGPDISISLFGDAAKAGASVGAAIPSQFAAAVQGGIEGLKTGASLAQSYLDAQIKQNQIEQLPITNARQEEALKNDRLVNQQAEQNLKEDQALNSPKALKALQYQTNRFIQLSQDPGQKDTFAKAVGAGEFNLLFSRNEKLGEAAIKSTFSDWSADQQKSYLGAINQKTYAEQLAKRDFEEAKKFDEREASFASQQLTKQLIAEGGGKVLPLQVYRKGTLYTRLEKPTVYDSSGKPIFASGVQPTNKTYFKYGGNDYEVNKDFVDSLSDYGAAVSLKEKRLRGQLVGDAIAGAEAKEAETTAQVSKPTTVLERQKATAEKIRSELGKSIKKELPSGGQFTVTSTGTGEKVVTSTTDLPAGAVITTPSGQTFTSKEARPRDYTVTAPTPVDKFVERNPVLKGQEDLTKAVSYVESAAKGQKSVSPAGAIGLMQIMPATFADVQRRYGSKYPQIKNYDINNAAQNVEVGNIYLAEQIKRFGSQVGQGLELALAAYNAGPGAIQNALERADEKSWEGVKRYLKQHFKPSAYAEVSTYPDKVLAALAGKGYGTPKKGGLTNVQFTEENPDQGYGYATDDQPEVAPEESYPQDDRLMGQQPKFYNNEVDNGIRREPDSGTDDEIIQSPNVPKPTILKT